MSRQIEIKLRVRNIAIQLESGKTNAEIINDCTVQWKVSSRTVERYMAFAVKMVIQKMDEEKTSNEAKRLIEIIEKSGLHIFNPKVQDVLNKFQKTIK